MTARGKPARHGKTPSADETAGAQVLTYRSRAERAQAVVNTAGLAKARQALGLCPTCRSPIAQGIDHAAGCAGTTRR